MYKDKVCAMANCNNVFTPTSGSQKYCIECKEDGRRSTDRIRDRKRSRKKYDYTEYDRECLCCGDRFRTYYKKKLYCGKESCEYYRLFVKNKNTHIHRDGNYMIEKGRRYYRENRKQLCLDKAIKYRESKDNVGPYVAGKINRFTIEYVTEYVEKFGYKLLSNKYVNNRSKIKLLCPNDHEWSTTFHNFKDGEARCFFCYLSNNYTSKFERSVRDYVESIYDGNILYNNREIVLNKNTGRYLELDIHLPEINKAIECDGAYWHSRKDMVVRDKIKDTFCTKNNINLIRISDIDWYREECFNSLKDFIGN
jgi:hypothetical protein